MMNATKRKTIRICPEMCESLSIVRFAEHERYTHFEFIYLLWFITAEYHYRLHECIWYLPLYYAKPIAVFVCVLRSPNVIEIEQARKNAGPRTFFSFWYKCKALEKNASFYGDFFSVLLQAMNDKKKCIAFACINKASKTVKCRKRCIIQMCISRSEFSATTVYNPPE